MYVLIIAAIVLCAWWIQRTIASTAKQLQGRFETAFGDRFYDESDDGFKTLYGSEENVRELVKSYGASKYPRIWKPEEAPPVDHYFANGPYIEALNVGVLNSRLTISRFDSLLPPPDPGYVAYWLDALCSAKNRQMVPLRARVNAIREEDWPVRFAPVRSRRPKREPDDPEAISEQDDAITKAVQAILTGSCVVLTYRDQERSFWESELGKEPRTVDATAFLTLKMNAAQFQTWNDVCARFIGGSSPPISLQISSFEFADSDGTGLDGRPTWEAFLSGETYVCARSFSLSIAPTWLEVRFR